MAPQTLLSFKPGYFFFWKWFNRIKRYAAYVLKNIIKKKKDKFNVLLFEYLVNKVPFENQKLILITKNRFRYTPYTFRDALNVKQNGISPELIVFTEII